MPFPVCPSTKIPFLCSEGLKMRVFEAKSAQKPRFCARNARKWGFRRAKAHKNADFVLGDGCREPSSAHRSSALPATSPAGCIWQQCARQQIAATYHATCRRACCRNLLPRPTCRSYYRAYRRGTTAKSYRRVLPLAHLSPCNLPPGILPCIPPWRYRQVTTAKYLPAGAYYRAMGPAPSGRVIRM